MNTSTRTSMNALVCVVAILSTCIICSHSAEASYMRYTMKEGKVVCDVFFKSECKGNPFKWATYESDVLVKGSCYKSIYDNDFFKVSSVGTKTVSYQSCSQGCIKCERGTYEVKVDGKCFEERLEMDDPPYFVYDPVCGAKLTHQ
eukprot:Nk52_evm1s796 gene=Nk52_evmTU1s796